MFTSVGANTTGQVASERFERFVAPARSLSFDGQRAALAGLAVSGPGGYSAAQFVSERLGPMAPAAPRVGEHWDAAAALAQSRTVAAQMQVEIGPHAMAHFFDFLIAASPGNF